MEEKYDLYAEANRLIQLLVKEGAQEHADYLSDAMYGSTGGEVCSALKWHIGNMLKLDFISEEASICVERLWMELDKVLR